MLNSQASCPSVSSGNARDPELATRAENGDERAFERIMRHHNRLLFRTARSISNAAPKPKMRCRAHLRAWRSLTTFRAESKLSTWLVGIVIVIRLTPPTLPIAVNFTSSRRAHMAISAKPVRPLAA